MKQITANMNVKSHTERVHFCIAGSHPCLAQIGHVLAKADGRYGIGHINGRDEAIVRRVQTTLPQVVVVADCDTLRCIQAALPPRPVVKFVFVVHEEIQTGEEMERVICSDVDAVLFAPLQDNSIKAALTNVLAGRHSIKPILRRLRKRLAASRAFESETVVGAAEGGAGRDAQNSRQILSTRQIEIMELICSGCGTKMIADKLGIGEHTVSKTMQTIRFKLNAASGMQAVAIYVEQKLQPQAERRL